MKGKLLGILWILMFLMATVVSGTGVELTSSSPAEIHVYPGQSIQEAINAAAPGDTIIIHEGTYNEKLVVDKSLTIEGVDKEQVILNGTGLSEKGISVEADYVTIRNLTVCCFVEGNWPWGVELVDASHCIVEDLIVYNCTSGGINLYRGCHNNTVRNNLIKYCDGNGISIYGSDEGCWHNLIENNEIIDCAFAETGGGTYRVPAICIFSNASYNTVTGNIIRQEAYVGRGRGITLWGSTYGGSDMAETGNIIENNFVENFDIGIYIIGVNLYTGTKNLVTYTTVRYNNLTKNNVGFKQIGFEGDYSPITLRYNNIYDNHDYGALVDATYGTAILDARFNWWGDASGPSGMGPGAGDAISENVTYSPWLGYPYGTIPMTYHVDPTGKIQDAINDANPGDTIKVHEGTYTEQLIINKSLTLIGDPMPKIVAPDTRATFTIPECGHTFDPIIFAYGSLTGTETISVTIQGFEIDGGNKAGSNRYVAILCRNVKPAIISDNLIHSMYPPSGTGKGPQTFGILVYGDSTATISHNEIRDFSRGGIGVLGDAGQSVDPVAIIQENMVFGNGFEPETGWWAENGIQVGYGASGEVIGNQVFNCTVNNPNYAASGIMIVDTHEVTVDSNYVEGCDVGICAVDFPSVYGPPWDYDILSNVLITRNVLVGNIWQIDVSNDARNVTITYNDIINATEDGIDIWSYFGDVYPTDVKIHYNNIEGSGSYGIWASEELAAQPVDARFNWWGSATGPYHPTLNDYGKGDNVSDNVDFWNWLIIPYPPAIASPVPPVASFTYTPFAPIVNEYVTFDASGSYSIDGYIATYVWDFGDGNLTETSNPIIMHKFDSAGTYSVNLTVIDNLGATRSYVKDVIVYPPPPTNVKISPYESSVCIGQEFTINIVIENVSDLAGFELKLFWNTTLADLEDVDIFPPWSDYFLVKNETQEDIGDGRGMFWLALLMLPPSEPFNGTTVLATLTFNATNIGTSILDLDQVKLGDSLANPIPTNIVDGYIESHIAIPGDVDGNGHVDIYDLIIWAGAFGTFAGEPDFNPAADLNNDGVIDIYDGIIIAINYGA